MVVSSKDIVNLLVAVRAELNIVYDILLCVAFLRELCYAVINSFVLGLESGTDDIVSVKDELCIIRETLIDYIKDIIWMRVSSVGVAR